jgi:hypothetical protein
MTISITTLSKKNSVIGLSLTFFIVMVSVVMLNVILLSAVAPLKLCLTSIESYFKLFNWISESKGKRTKTLKAFVRVHQIGMTANFAFLQHRKNGPDFCRRGTTVSLSKITLDGCTHCVNKLARISFVKNNKCKENTTAYPPEQILPSGEPLPLKFKINFQMIEIYFSKTVIGTYICGLDRETT